MTMSGKRKTAAAGLVACAVTGGVLLGAAPAQAASYNGVCGSGYAVVNQKNIGNLGTVFLTYNASKGMNCVVTVRNSPGSAVRMAAAIAREDDAAWYAIDDDYYTTYAGPVYRAAAGRCVTWLGGIGTQSSGGVDTNCG
ncbi:spore-associated protein A [Saccharopolyspora sp. MS10]|uniref:spore-associated protein A n=1 Tax=Saccharopolyspora sp. MS10 TaxID=3385973 RepID=UPI0039A316C8